MKWLRFASAASAIVAACTSFAGEDPVGAPTADGGPAEGGVVPSADGDIEGAAKDARVFDADAGVIDFDADSGDAGAVCQVKPGIGCESNGCPSRCPPNVQGPASDVLSVESEDASVVTLRNRSDCHRYECTATANGASFDCAAPGIGRRARVCATSNPVGCPVSAEFSVGVGNEFNCQVDPCSYKCTRVPD